MNREEAEKRYQELLQKLAKEHYEGNNVGVQKTLKEIETVRLRMLNIDINEAIREYKPEQIAASLAQK